jgi:hypothetical protein
MPTGYTAGIEDGSIKTFQDFAKHCVRAFGASIHMRDEPLTKPYEPRMPEPFYMEKLQEIAKEIDSVNEMTDEDLLNNVKNDLLESKKYYNKSVKKAMLYKTRLNKILKEVEKYTPPTPDHEGIKKFMAEQIESTIKWDCNTDYYTKEVRKIDKQLNNLDAVEVRKSKLEELHKDLEYYTKRYNEDVETCKNANEWAEKFFKSIENL